MYVHTQGVLGGLLRSEGHGMRAGHSGWGVQQWSKCSNILGALFVVFFVIAVLLHNLWMNVYVELWGQLGIAWWALEFIMAMSYDEGTSFVLRILSSEIALFLGRISYAVYLVHHPVQQYVCWIANGSISSPDCGDDDNSCGEQWDEYRDRRRLPVWCIPIVCTVSVIVAILMNRFFEEPLRKKLRPSRSGRGGDSTAKTERYAWLEAERAELRPLQDL